MAKERAERELNKQEEAFCLEYARCWSPTDAGQKVGLSGATAYRWLQDPGIKWRVRELAKQLAAEVHIEVPQLLRELAFLAHFDPIDILDDAGTPRPLKEIPQFARKAIKEMDVEVEYAGEDASGLPISTRITKIKFIGKEKALELLGKFKKLFADEDDTGQKPVRITINAGPCPHCGKDRGQG